MSTSVICGYSLSGGYGPIPRFLYYVLLIVSLVFHRTEWLVGSTLGASMIFSSISAVHAVALASARGRGTVDLDIIPVFSITGVGMVIAVPLLVWSKALREAKRSVRIIAFLWIMVMFVGVIASLASLGKLPTPLDCGDQSTPGCPLICEVGLPMRDGQLILVVPFVTSDLYAYWWTVIYPGLAFPLMVGGLSIAGRRKHPMEQAQDALRAKTWTPRQRRKNSNNTLFCVVCAPPLSVGLGVAHVVLMELILIGPRSVPLGESMTAIGQWGPSLVGAAFALMASVIEWKLSMADRGKDVGARLKPPTSRHLESTTLQHSSGALPLRHSGPTTLDDQLSERIDIAGYFEEGRWWSTGANGMVITHVHEGVKWVVREGYWRHFEENNEIELKNSTVPTPVPVVIAPEKESVGI